MTDEPIRFSLSTVTSLVDRMNRAIERTAYQVIKSDLYDKEKHSPSVYAQSYVIGEEDEDEFADDHFIVWSSGIKFASREEDINIEETFFFQSSDGNNYKVVVPMKIPKNLQASVLEGEYAAIPEKVELKKSGIKFDEVETAQRSLSGLVNGDIQGVDSELMISADVLKRRLAGKNMDATLKYAIINAKTVKKNIEALNFALASCSRNYTHTAWHLMYALLDLYRHIDRQSQK